MRFLFVSKELIGSALCHRLLREGCEVKLFIEQPGCKQSLDGIIEKTDDWHKELSWVGKDGVIVFDDVGHGAEQDALRRDGYSVVGGTEKSDRLELERSYFQEVLKDLGVPSLASYEFQKWKLPRILYVIMKGLG
jgi:phosphoribosylamine--glycine ligase